MVDKEHPLITKVKEQFAEGKMNRREFLREPPRVFARRHLARPVGRRGLRLHRQGDGG